MTSAIPTPTNRPRMRHHQPNHATLLPLIATAALLAAPIALSQSTDPEPDPNPEQPTQPEPSEPSESTGGSLGGALDDLLGLDDEQQDNQPTTDATNQPNDPSREELERVLTGRQASDTLLQALQQMDETADRLGELGDAGPVTQRLQEEVLRKLEVLIRSAEEQEQQRSRSQQNQQQQQQEQQSQRRPGQQQQAQQQSQAGEQRQGENNGSEQPPPPREDGPINELVEAAGAAWGALPARVRESLVQGLNDRFSSLYERETEAYYRRLAEQGTNDDTGDDR